MSENFIYDESAEISIGEDLTWGQKLVEAFPAFKSRDYQLYFGGQLISLIGTWLQIVAEGWLVLQLTNSPFLIGLVVACASLPSLFFSLIGGVIVDSFSRKHILVFTQVAAMVLALIYGSMTVLHIINIYEIAILAFLLGTVSAIDIPARQAFTVEMVDKEGLASAIALNSGVFNGARVIGPAVAGLLIALVGTGGAFILNGLSYIAGIAALLAMSTHSVVAEKHTNPVKAIKEGVTYSFSHPVIKNLLIFTGIVSIFGWSYGTIMPYIAKHTFHIEASGLGYLYAASGLGALVGTFLLSFFSKKLSPLTFILGGTAVFCVALILFSISSSLTLALPLLFFAGLGLIAQFATMNTTIQHMVDHSMRGRVMSIYTLMFLGLSPFGSLEIGFLSDHLGPSAAMQIGAVVVLLYAAYLFVKRHDIQKEQEAFQAAE